MSSFGGTKVGKAIIEFANGDKLEYKEFPTLSIENIFNKTKKQIYYD